jgi:hypothetical protein
VWEGVGGGRGRGRVSGTDESVYTCMEDESKVFRCGTTSQEGTLNTFHISLL